MVLRHLDLLFEGKNILNLKSLYLRNGKSYRKNVWEIFVDFDICHGIMSLRILYYVTLIYFLKGPNNSTISLEICFSDDYRQKIVSNIHPSHPQLHYNRK